jgi:hypothetical protein
MLVHLPLSLHYNTLPKALCLHAIMPYWGFKACVSESVGTTAIGIDSAGQIVSSYFYANTISFLPMLGLTSGI